MSKREPPRLQVESEAELWKWLGRHHGQSQSVWLVTFKASDPARYISRSQVLDALIAHGWIDGRRMKLDDSRTMQLIAPRKEQRWAKTYQDRAAKLEREGRMKAPGRAAIERAKKAGTWDDLADVDALEVPKDLAASLEQMGAAQWWNEAAPSYRRNVLRWIAKAKRTQTRHKRVNTVAGLAAKGQKVPNY